LLGIAGTICGLEVAVLLEPKTGVAVAGATALGGFACAVAALRTSGPEQDGSRFAWAAVLVNVPGLISAALLISSVARF
jgi:hypothetical protein